MFGYFLISLMKPWIRCSVVDTPGCSFITTTDPLEPISLASASAALAPPWMLSEEIEADAIVLSLTVVSTWTTLIPALFICFIGAISAWVSVGAISTAPGLLGRDRVDDRDLLRRGEVRRTLDVHRVAELLGLGLRAAAHRHVEVVGLGPLDQGQLLAAASLPPLELLELLELDPEPEAALELELEFELEPQPAIAIAASAATTAGTRNPSNASLLLCLRPHVAAGYLTSTRSPTGTCARRRSWSK